MRGQEITADKLARLSREEREEMYKLARERIFGNSEDSIPGKGHSIFIRIIFSREPLANKSLQRTMEKLACLGPAQFPLPTDPTLRNAARLASSVVMTRTASTPETSTLRFGVLSNRRGSPSLKRSMFLQHQANSVPSLKHLIPPRWLLAIRNMFPITPMCLSWLLLQTIPLTGCPK